MNNTTLFFTIASGYSIMGMITSATVAELDSEVQRDTSLKFLVFIFWPLVLSIFLIYSLGRFALPTLYRAAGTPARFLINLRKRQGKNIPTARVVSE